MKSNRPFRLATAAISFLVTIQMGHAQSFGVDARRVALGGAGSEPTSASKLIENNRPYSVIPLPLGLFRVFKNRMFFDPNDPEFNPVRAIENASNPLHITLNQNADSAGNRLVNNLVNAQLSRDLNDYRGFTPSADIKAVGLITPSWGKTFRVHGDSASVASHSVYVGAGPYLSLGTALNVDRNLIDLLASPTVVYRPNTNFKIADTMTGQGAFAITGGYRGYFAIPKLQGDVSTSGRKTGLQVSASYSHLRGVHYDSADLDLRFDTDSAGLVWMQPTTTPVVVNRVTSKSGNGFAIDVAAALVTRHWDISFGVDGIANRINWKNLVARRYALRSLFDGGDFVSQPAIATSDIRRVNLPIRYSGGSSYYSDRWSAAVEIGRGLNEQLDFNGGGEIWMGRIALRGGARYSRNVWHGATGLGFNITPKVGIDVAAFQNSANIEESRRPSFAVSVRLNHDVMQ